MSYDPKCEELAKYFLPSGSSERAIQLLAQRIQDAVEDELQVMAEMAEQERRRIH